MLSKLFKLATNVDVANVKNNSILMTQPASFLKLKL